MKPSKPAKKANRHQAQSQNQARNRNFEKRVLVGLSGGRESAIVAALLKSQGYEVVAVHFRFKEVDEPSPYDSFHCYKSRKEQEAKAFAKKLDIEFHVIGLSEAFEYHVVDPLVHAGLDQTVPKSCYSCTKELKFKNLLEKADQLQCGKIATGHYALINIDVSNGAAKLFRAVDLKRDQSHLLYDLDQAVLKRTLTPLGGLSSALIDRLALELGFERSPPLVRCKGSEEFHYDLIEKRTPPSLRLRGPIRTFDNNIVGDHEGLHRFRIGQKDGFKLGLKAPEAFRVIGFEPLTRVLIVGLDSHLMHSEYLASAAVWVTPVDAIHTVNCQALIAGVPEPQNVRITLFENQAAYLEFDEPQYALNVGQVLVFLKGNEILGGAEVEKIGKIELQVKF